MVGEDFSYSKEANEKEENQINLSDENLNKNSFINENESSLENGLAEEVNNDLVIGKNLDNFIKNFQDLISNDDNHREKNVNIIKDQNFIDQDKEEKNLNENKNI